jgi:hypothetical protein
MTPVARESSSTPIVTGESLTPPSTGVSEFDVWKPILWLVVILFLGYLSPLALMGLIMLFFATIWVYRDSKKHGLSESLWVVTLLFAIVGLPLYAYRLHQLRTGMIVGKPAAESGRTDYWRTITKIVAVIWVASLAVLIVSILMYYSGKSLVSDFLAMVSSGTLVLFTIILLPLSVVFFFTRSRRKD